MSGENEFVSDGTDHGVSPDVADVAPPAASSAARRQQITRDLVSKPDLKPEERAALTAELAQIVAKQSSPDVADVAPAAAGEKQIATLRQHPAFLDAKHQEHGEVMRQYRAATFNVMTEEERTDLADATPAEIRSMYGVKGAREILTPSQHEQWAGDEHQVEAVLFLAREGVEAGVVQEMNEYAIGRIAAYGGERLPDHEIESFVARYKGKVPEAAMTKLIRWARDEAGL